MDALDADLNEWVAVKSDAFMLKSGEDKDLQLICEWNNEEQKMFISEHEDNLKASGFKSKKNVCLLSINELRNIHRQFTLIDASVDSYFPKELKPNNTFLSIFQSKPYPSENVCRSLEKYLSTLILVFGWKLLFSMLFNEEDSLNDFEENIYDFKVRTLEISVKKAFEELDEVLTLRNRAESLLEMSTVYILEDEVIKNVLIALTELYHFHLEPFLFLREISDKTRVAKNKLEEEMSSSIKTTSKHEYEDWEDDQSLSAIEALQHIYQEYYHKTSKVITAQRDRILSDQAKFGKAAFELYGLDRLQQLEVQVSKEKLKLLNTIKSVKEYQRDKIQQQLASVNSDKNASEEIERIESEIYEAQINVLNSHFEVLEVEEKLYKSELAILNKKHKDELDFGIFYDAVEDPDEIEDIECEPPKRHPKAHRQEKKLSNLYRKRAAIRNQKKMLIAEEQKRKEKRLLSKAFRKTISSVQLQSQRRSRELPAEKIKEERKKTFQRLREYKKKMMEQKLKSQNMDNVAEILKSEVTSIEKGDLSQDNYVQNSGDKNCNSGSFLERAEEPQTITTGDKMSVALQLPPAPPPPPPPPPPPMPNISSIPLPSPASLSLKSTQNPKSVSLPPLKDVRKTNTINNIQLSDILTMRSKLKKVEDFPSASNADDSSADNFTSLLQSALIRVRNHVHDSDLESNSDSSDDDFK